MPQPPTPSFLTASLLVATGGAFGSWLRFTVSTLWDAASPARSAAFPWPTLTVNVAGSMAMGLLAGWLTRLDTPGETIRLLLAVGVLGGFTSFSALSLETVSLIQRGQAGLALAYLAGSLVAGIGGLWLGLVAMRPAT